MDDAKKIRRTFYLSEDINDQLNDFVSFNCVNAETGTTYGGASFTIENAVSYYMSNYIADRSLGVMPTRTSTVKMKFKVIEDE